MKTSNAVIRELQQSLDEWEVDSQNEMEVRDYKKASDILCDLKKLQRLEKKQQSARDVILKCFGDLGGPRENLPMRRIRSKLLKAFK